MTANLIQHILNLMQCDKSQQISSQGTSQCNALQNITTTTNKSIFQKGCSLLFTIFTSSVAHSKSMPGSFNISELTCFPPVPCVPHHSVDITYSFPSDTSFVLLHTLKLHLTPSLPFCPSLGLLPQEEEDLQSEVTVHQWSSLSVVLPYSHQQCGFGGTEFRGGCSGCAGVDRGPGLLFLIIYIFFNMLTSRFNLSLPLYLLSGSANILFLISSQFCSCVLTTSTIPIVSILIQKTL